MEQSPATPTLVGIDVATGRLHVHVRPADEACARTLIAELPDPGRLYGVAAHAPPRKAPLSRLIGATPTRAAIAQS